MPLKSNAEVQWAIVTSEQAYIYADQDRTSPIGYVSKGKKFKVGSIPRNNGTMLPLIVSGRVAYIKIVDIATSYDKFLLELPSDRYVRIQKPQMYEKDVTFYMHTFSSNLETGQYDANVADEKGANFFGMTIQGLVALEVDWFLGTSFTIEKTEVETQSLSNIYINLDSLYKFTNRYRYYVGTMFTVGFSPNSRLTVDNAFKLSGQSFQFLTGFQFGYLLDKTSFKLDLGYRFQAFSNYDVPDTLEEFRPVISGPHIGFGVAINY
jgi:hypothetical protein